MKISFLFPEKNQGEKLIRHLKEMVLPFLDKQPIAYDVLICPNGCSEEEMDLLEEAKKELPLQVRVLKNVIPGGKGRGDQRSAIRFRAFYGCGYGNRLGSVESLFAPTPSI